MNRIFLAILIACSLLTCAAAQEDSEISYHIGNEAAQERVRTELGSARRFYQDHQYANALSVLEDVRNKPDADQVPGLRSILPFGVGCLHSLLNQQSQAIDSLEQALAAGLTSYSYYGDEFDLDPIRLEPRFRLLMAEVRKRNGISPLSWDRHQVRTVAVPSDSSGVPDLLRIAPELHLDDLRSNEGDYNKLLRVAQWAAAQWKSCDDAVAEATPAASGLGRTCSEHASLMAGAAHAFGMRARVVELIPKEVDRRADSHAVAEAWLDSYRKWVLADGQYGIVPQLNGVPLNAIELQSALASGQEVTCGTDALTCVRWSDFVLQYLYYFRYGQAPPPTPQLILKPMGAARPYRRNADTGAFEQAVYVSNPDLLYAPAEAGTAR